MRNLMTGSGIRFISTLLAVALALPLSWGSLTGLYTWLSPFIMLNSVFTLKSMVWLNTLGFAVLLISFFQRRWFCRYLCPVGWGCDKVSGINRRKSFSLRQVPDFGGWLALISLTAALAGMPVLILLDPMSIFNGFFSAFSGTFSIKALLLLSGLPVLLAIHLLLPGIWCKRICPLGGLQDEVSNLRNLAGRLIPKSGLSDNSRDYNAGRRYFIASGIGVISGLAISGISFSAPENYFRPPGSVHEDLFNTLCIRCGNCIKSCPTDIIIHQTRLNYPAGLMTPEVTFANHGYCLEDCNLCSRVCPSGAITLFDIRAKSRLKMGTAIIDPENCLLTRFEECDGCHAICGYKAIDFVRLDSTIQMIPVANADKCTGCGACAAICPTETIEMIPPESKLSGSSGEFAFSLTNPWE